MNFSYVGELAALGAAACWAVTAIFFTVSGRRIGPYAVNLLRLALALLFVLMAHRIALGSWLPQEAGPDRWGWLALSGVIGLTLGDAALLQALVHIGPRLSWVLMSTVPLITTLLGWAVFHERLGRLEYLSIPLTVGGVAWVVSERTSGDSPSERPLHFRRGIWFALGGALGQSLGLITSRLGLEGEFPVISANLIRTLAAALGLWVPTLLAGRGSAILNSVRADQTAFMNVLGGAITGPVVGVTLSLLAVQRAPVGIASTLMSLSPILMLPLVRALFGERISLRAVGGTAVALVGAALIFLF